MQFEQNIAWIKPSKYINSCSKSVISSSFNMHTTHSELLHYNHQVKYWWWFFAPTFYALVFFTKSLHHVYYNTQLFAKKHISCVAFLLRSPSGGIPPFYLHWNFPILQFEISSLIFLSAVGCKIQVWNGLKI